MTWQIGLVDPEPAAESSAGQPYSSSTCCKTGLAHAIGVYEDRARNVVAR